MSAPTKSDASAAPAVLHKLSRMKDALINCVDIPMIAMWRDESLSIPNKAAIKMMYRHADPTNEETYDFLSRFRVFDDKFENELDPEGFPIMTLCRTQQPFRGWKIGLLQENGDRTVWECNGDGIYDDKTGEFLGGITSLKDVTKYEEMMKIQHEENEQQFQLICETMPQLLWTTTPDGEHDWFSGRWYDYTGLTHVQSMGQGWQVPFHPDDMPATRQRWMHSLATGDEYSTEYRCRNKDGQYRWMLGKARPLRDTKTGRILKWFGSCTDIHEVVEARREAKDSRDHLGNVIRNTRVSVWSVDMSRNMTLFEGRRPWRTDTVEMQPSIKVGRNYLEIFHELQEEAKFIDFDACAEVVERFLRGEDRKEAVIESYDEGTGQWIRSRFLPIFADSNAAEIPDDSPVTGVICLVFDFTDQKVRDLALQQRKEENLRLSSAETAAKEASRLKSQFLANMSHEIRTPIAGVIGMSELLLDTHLNQEQQDFAENIQRSANGLLTVINDILDLSKVESGRLDIEEVQFSLSVVINDVCKMLSFAAERKNLGFESDIRIGNHQDLIVMGDPGRIRQILTNLLTNSIKFTSEGYVKLGVATQEVKNENVRVKFVVEDTGIGIEEEVQHRLFKPFSQADSSTARRFGGTGLGLTICKNLVDLMHGEITLDSELDRGTKATFWITFNKPQFTSRNSPNVSIASIPERLRSEMSVSGCSSDMRNGNVTPPKSPMHLAEVPAGSTRHQSALTRSENNDTSPPSSSDGHNLEIDRKNIHVLVVEDNAINQQIAIKTIQKLGFSVNAVWNGKEALDYILKPTSEDHTRPDIVLMDVQMPILDGYRATHMIRHHSPYSSIAGIRSVPIIAMTASAIQGDKEKCKSAGMDDYLAKPVKGKTLEGMLLKWAIESRRKDRSKRHAAAHSDKSRHGADCDRLRASAKTSQDAAKTSKSIYSTAGGSSQSTLKPAATIRAKSTIPKPLAGDSEDMQTHGRMPIQGAMAMPSAESEGERSLRRVRAEEKATSLRDNKLLAASESHPTQFHLHTASPVIGGLDTNLAPSPPADALTIENVTRFERENLIVAAGGLQRQLQQMSQYPPEDTLQASLSQSAATSTPPDEISCVRSSSIEPFAVDERLSPPAQSQSPPAPPLPTIATSLSTVSSPALGPAQSVSPLAARTTTAPFAAVGAVAADAASPPQRQQQQQRPWMPSRNNTAIRSSENCDTGSRDYSVDAASTGAEDDGQDALSVEQATRNMSTTASAGSHYSGPGGGSTTGSTTSSSARKERIPFVTRSVSERSQDTIKGQLSPVKAELGEGTEQSK